MGTVSVGADSQSTCAKVCRIGPLSYFSFHPVLHDWWSLALVITVIVVLVEVVVEIVVVVVVIIIVTCIPHGYRVGEGTNIPPPPPPICKNLSRFLIVANIDVVFGQNKLVSFLYGFGSLISLLVKLCKRVNGKRCYWFVILLTPLKLHFKKINLPPPKKPNNINKQTNKQTKTETGEPVCL